MLTKKWMGPLGQRWKGLTGVVLTLVVLTGCAPSPPSNEPLEVSVNFIDNYDEWAQVGYAPPLPESLRSIASESMLGVFEDDQNWYYGGAVQQHGSVNILGTELLGSNNDHAVVRVVIDASNVSVTADGEQTFVDYSKPIVTLINLKKEGNWRITSTSSGD